MENPPLSPPKGAAVAPPECAASAPHGADQLILTIASDGAFIEGSDGHLPCERHDARDTEAVLATIGRWLFHARRRQGHAQ